MIPSRRQRFLLLRFPRRILAACVVVIYLLAGALHGFCEIDVANPSGKTFISLADNGSGSSEKGTPAGHHCHGCFSVSVPTAVTASFDRAPVRDTVVARVVNRRGLVRGIDPPPPKNLI